MSGNHSYHLVEPSPWPAVGAAGGFVLVLGAAMYMHEYAYGGIAALVGFGLVLLTMFYWWRDIVREGEFQGHHSPIVQIGLRYGMMLFIASEVIGICNKNELELWRKPNTKFFSRLKSFYKSKNFIIKEVMYFQLVHFGLFAFLKNFIGVFIIILYPKVYYKLSKFNFQDTK